MQTSSLSPAHDVLSFWFGELDADGRAKPEFSARWYKKDPGFDQEIRTRFSELFAALVRHAPRPEWIDGPDGLLAAVIVLDQFSRNMFRDSKEMYDGDTRALRYSFEMIALGYDRKLPAAQRVFVYMPLMHAEHLATQDRCVELFGEFADEADGDDRKGFAKYAVVHRDIVARFGRFPHRNELVGRVSTEEELKFLKEPGSSF